jgi:HD-like signal output (HDOD) protein
MPAVTVYTLLSAEKEILGITHAEIGMILAEKWELPPIWVSLWFIITVHHRRINCGSGDYGAYSGCSGT